MHVIKGNSRLYTPQNQLDLQASDSLVMKCGSYLNNWFKNEDENPNKAVLVHLYPDVLKAVYEDKMPDFLSLVSEELVKIKVKEIVLLLVNTENSGRIIYILKGLFPPNQYKFKEIIHAHLFI